MINGVNKSVRITERSLFYWIYRHNRLMQMFLFVVILVSLFFKVFPLEMQKRIVNEAIYLKDLELLYLYCGLYIGAVTVAGLLKYLINILQVYIGQRILIEMRRELYSHILQLPLQFYRKMQPGTVVSAMTAELNAIGLFLGGAIAVPVTSILTFIVFLAFMFSLNTWLALLSMGVYPVEIFLIPYLQKKYNLLNRKRVKTTRAMANVVNEAISGIQEVHGNDSYELEGKRLSFFNHKLYSLMKRLFMVKYGIKFTNNFFQSLGPFILFLVGGYMAIHGQFTLGALVAFLSAYEKVYDPWKEMIEYYQDYQDAKIRYAQIMKIFDLDPPHLMLPAPGRELYRFCGNIEISNVTFTVPGGVKLLEGINLKVKEKTMVALVGYSGSGKSTLALLMAQLYDTDQGTIELDDVPIGELCKRDLGVNVAMISQQPFIFSGTIRENLLYGVMAIGDDDSLPSRTEIHDMVRAVGFEDDLIRFGLQAVLGVEQCEPFREKFLRMRQIVQTSLRMNFENTIEFYEASKFLYYSTIRDNIVFGDSLSREYAVERLPENRPFMALLAEMNLVEVLSVLGYTIARRTVNLLADFQDDEFFFRDNPMEASEFRRYTLLLEKYPDLQDFDHGSRKYFLVLALRFIPGKHNIVSLPPGLEEKILQARCKFHKEIAGFDMDNCLKHGASSPCAKSVRCGKSSDFVPFCPSEYLYNRTLLDNILFGAVKSSQIRDENLRELVARAFEDENLLDEVVEIGLSFEVGSKGDRLSGGQKQKLAIARAFLKDAPIIIMDEATASLDNNSQARIQEIIETKFRGKKTVVAVIHRLDLTPAYDHIVLLKAGRILEQGSYQELIDKKGSFYELARSET